MVPATLIYDGECRFCRATIAWISRHARPGQLEYLPCQAEEHRRRFPDIAEAACLEAMQLVLPSGQVLSGDQALPEVLRRMRRWRWLAALFRVPGMGWLAPRGYRWIARHRYAISCAVARREGCGGGS